MFARILKIILLDMIPTFLDIGTDLINSLDMIGFNTTSTIITEVVNTVTDVAGNGTFFSDLLPEVGNSTSSYHEDFIWGGVGLALIFAPGIPMAITILIEDFKDARSRCAAVLAFTCYPIFIFIVQFWGICNSGMADTGIVLAVGGEAFFESGPQMVLQLFTIQYGYQTGPLQIATICLSFFLLAKTAVMVDLLYLETNGTKFENSWKICCIEIPIQKIQHVLTVIPAYTTGIMFRIGALSITTAYLRYWSIIPIILLIVQYAATANHLGYDKEDIPIAVISNLGSMTKGAMYTDVKSSNMFLVISAMLTFFYHCTCLVTILVMTTVSPSYFSHWETRLVFFHYTNHIICGVIGMGIINLILIFATGHKLNGPKMMKSMESIPHEEIGLKEMNKEGSSKVFSAEVENDVL